MPAQARTHLEGQERATQQGKARAPSSASLAHVKSSAHLVNMHILTPRNAPQGTSSFILLDFPGHGI